MGVVEGFWIKFFETKILRREGYGFGVGREREYSLIGRLEDYG